MDYSLLTEQKLQKRFYTLSDNLRDALDSENNIEDVRRICRSHYLNDEEKILIIEQLTGLVLLGFLSSAELSQEIAENLHLNKRHSDDIAAEIDRKIFEPIKSDLEKVYSPAEALTMETAPPTKEEGEEIIDLRKTETKETQYGEVQSPEVKPRQFGEIETSKTEKKPEASPESALSPRKSAAEEGPKIIHQEKKISVLTDAGKRSLSGLFGFLRKEKSPKEDKRKKESAAPIKVQMETAESFGKPTAPEKPPAVAKTEIPKPRIVHYSDLRTPLSPPDANAEKQDKEIQPPKIKQRQFGKDEFSKIEKKPKPPKNLPTIEPAAEMDNKRGPEEKSPPEPALSAHKPAKEIELKDIPVESNSEEDIIDLRTLQRTKDQTTND